MKKIDNFLSFFGVLILFGLLVLGCDKNARRRKELSRMKGNFSIEQPVSSEIHSIDAKLYFGDLKLLAGDAFSVRADCSYKELMPEIRESDGKLTISQSEKVRRKQFPENIMCVVEITCQSGKAGGKRFSEIDLASIVGNVSVQGVSSDAIMVNCGVGNLKVSDCFSAESSVESDTGNISVENLSSSILTVKTATGNQSISNTSFDELNASSKLGNVRIRGIKLLSDYSIDLNVGIGSIILGGEKQGKSCKVDGGPKKINASTETGNITVE